MFLKNKITKGYMLTLTRYLLTYCLAASTTSISAEVIHQEPSLYHTILVEDENDIRCIKFNVKAININQSCMFKDQPNKFVFNYTKLLFSALLLNDQPKDILIIGLGGGSLSNALHQLLPETNITNIEIDPAMIKVARDHFNLVENEKVKTISQDGRLYIKRARLKKQHFDWIILDAFNGEYIPEHLLTKEFLSEAKDILKPNGLLSSNTFIGSQLFLHESATYHSVFGDFFSIKNDLKQNRVILAGKEPLTKLNVSEQRINQLIKALSPFGIDVSDLVKAMELATLNSHWPADTRILTDQYSPANLLLK